MQKTVRSKIIVVSNSVFRQLELPFSSTTTWVLPKPQRKEDLFRQIITIFGEALKNPDTLFEVSADMMYVYKGFKKIGGPYIHLWETVSTPENICLKVAKEKVQNVEFFEEMIPDYQLQLPLQLC